MGTDSVSKSSAAKSFWSQLKLLDLQGDVFRNIVSIHTAQDLFDDLSPNPQDWARAQQVEAEVKPPPYQSATPVIHRPFEDAQWFSAIGWPFTHWQASRFSDGSFGVWYGCAQAQTSVYETAYHWFNGLLKDAGFEHEAVTTERKVYSVACHAVLLDMRAAAAHAPKLLHKTDYRAAQAVGARLSREGHPGLVINSVRHATGENYAVFNPAVLSNPRLHCQVSYHLAGERIRVEKGPGVRWFDLAIQNL